MEDGQKDKAKIVNFVHKYRMAQYGRMILVSDQIKKEKNNQKIDFYTKRAAILDELTAQAEELNMGYE